MTLIETDRIIEGEIMMHFY